IKETIQLEPEKFYFYNNGISAICTDIIPIKNDKNIITQFKCINFQIINGAQTTTTIGKFKDKDRGKLAKVRVLLRITKAEDYKKEKGLNKKIVTYNNSQTIIKAGDFRSNDDIQIYLEQKIKDFKYKSSPPYKTALYQRKRIKTERKKDELIISIDVMVRALYVFDKDPLLVYKGARFFFDTDEDNGMYWRIFGDNGKELENYNESRLIKTIGIFFLWTRIEEKLKQLSKELKSKDQINTILYQATLAKWHFLYVYGNILNNYYSSELPNIFKKIAYGSLFEKNDNFIEK
ncbi:MAG TPA: AIPR family protein, partial [Parafilimonas sp.]